MEPYTVGYRARIPDDKQMSGTIKQTNNVIKIWNMGCLGYTQIIASGHFHNHFTHISAVRLTHMSV